VLASLLKIFRKMFCKTIVYVTSLVSTGYVRSWQIELYLLFGSGGAWGFSRYHKCVVIMFSTACKSSLQFILIFYFKKAKHQCTLSKSTLNIPPPTK